MITNPDMILQFCHMHARELELQGCEQVAIHAQIVVSLNGRDPQYMIDPRVNLASAPRNFWPAVWIAPLREPLPQNR